MKFDVAKNEDGPLRRTVNAKNSEERQGAVSQDGSHMESSSSGRAEATANRHPGLDERLRNLEEHLAVRYGE